MLANTFQVAAVIGVPVRAVGGSARASAWGRVVGGIAIGETIGHEQVNHIFGSESLKPPFRVERGIQYKLKLARARSALDIEFVFARLDGLIDGHVREQVFAVIRCITRLNLES